MAASLRDETPSLLKAEERWLLTVLSARNSLLGDLGVREPGDDERQNLPLTGRQRLRPDLPALSAGNRDLTRADHSDDRRERILGLLLQHDPVDPELECTPHLGPAGPSTDEHRRDVLEPRADQAHDAHGRAVWPVRGDHHAGGGAAVAGGEKVLDGRLPGDDDVTCGREGRTEPGRGAGRSSTQTPIGRAFARHIGRSGSWACHRVTNGPP